MLMECIDGRGVSWAYNGSDATLTSYKGREEDLLNDIEWMRKLPLYYEDHNFVYVHAGINVNKPMKKQNQNTLLWTREDFIYNPKKYKKRVVFGHTPVMLLGETSALPIKTKAGNIDIDTGCVFGGALTALIIEGSEVKEFYQVKNSSSKN